MGDGLEVVDVRDGRWVVRHHGQQVYGSNGTLRTLCDAYVEGVLYGLGLSPESAVSPARLAVERVANVLRDRYWLEPSTHVEGTDTLPSPHLKVTVSGTVEVVHLAVDEGVWWVLVQGVSLAPLTYRGSDRQVAVTEGPAVVAEAAIAQLARRRLQP